MSEQSIPSESDRAPSVGIAESPLHSDERTAFLAALVEAMKGPLAVEHARVLGDVERQREALIGAINARRDIDANRIRDLAVEDRQEIERWATAELRRVQLERDRRADELQHDLESSLAQHQVNIDREIVAAEAAIAAHRADLSAFFADLSRETDAVAFAEMAVRRPVFPSVETVAEREASAAPEVAPTTMPETGAPSAPLGAGEGAVPVPARPAAPPSVEVTAATPVPAPVAATPATAIPAPAAATAIQPEPEPTPVAVMDPIAARRAEWWEWWKNLPEPPDLTEVLDEVEQKNGNGGWVPPVPVPAGGGSEANESKLGGLLHSIPITRPMNLLRRGDHTNTER